MTTRLSPPQPAVSRPLCVDLDGTLISTDMLWESLLILLKHKPWTIFLVPIWLVRGRAHLKREIASRISFDPATLPYREDVLELLRDEKEAGREIVLATATDRSLAEPIAHHLGLFATVLASDGRTNLRSSAKLAAIQQLAGARGFDYIGDSPADLPLWEAATESFVVGSSTSLRRRVEARANVRRIFPLASETVRPLLRALRVHQWAKNVLLFVPLLFSHKILEMDRLAWTSLAFLSFSLTASSVYVLNDLLDLDFDRRHRTKRNRPFASGRLPVRFGLILAPLLLITGLLTARLAPAPIFLPTIAFYFAVSTAYSLRLKRYVLVDVFTLAGLYTLRVLAGGVAAAVVVSPWLLAFSMFLFLSLAYVKRYSELIALKGESRTTAAGRGYGVADVELLASIGSASGYLSAMVLALYVNSEQVVPLYTNPKLIWLICPLFLYWVTRIWLRAHRGEIHDDPLVAAFTDPISYLVGALIIAVSFAAL